MSFVWEYLVEEFEPFIEKETLETWLLERGRVGWELVQVLQGSVDFSEDLGMVPMKVILKRYKEVADSSQNVFMMPEAL